jgi:hypothetical protein
MTEHLDDNDVVSMGSSRNLLNTQTFKVGRLAKEMGERFGSSVVGNNWVDEGVECEVLRTGGTWRNGRIRVRLELQLEFVPDEEGQPHTGNQEENLL